MVANTLSFEQIVVCVLLHVQPTTSYSSYSVCAFVSCKNVYLSVPTIMQLLGQIDIDTREWTDGVLTYSARQVVKEAEDVQSWIVCDGDIDPEWIESLNSVLDDNR